MKTYYIYHIPNYKWKNGSIGKIGCTDNLRNRMYSYPKNTEYEILESHGDVYIASDREIFLQKKYGYSVDTIPYWKTLKIATKESRSKAGQIGGKTGGKIGGKRNVESGHIITIGKLASEARKRPILQYHKDGKFIKEFYSITEAANVLNLNQGNINKVCQGKNKTTGGFIFRYKL